MFMKIWVGVISVAMIAWFSALAVKHRSDRIPLWASIAGALMWLAAGIAWIVN